MTTNMTANIDSWKYQALNFCLSPLVSYQVLKTIIVFRRYDQKYR